MYYCTLSKYQISMIVNLCDSILKDPTVRFSKNKYKVELRTTLLSIKDAMADSLAYGNLDDDSEGE